MLSDNAKKIMKELYALNGENVDDTFVRVAKEFATNESELTLAKTLLKENVWRPNSPVFFNAGTSHKIFSACYVVPLEDSMNGIYDVANVARKIFQHGAGVGIPIGNLREKDAFIYEGNRDVPANGKSSGPISFMKLYDAVGDTTKSGGRNRRAAIMVSMPVWHPDILDFIKCKDIDGTFRNMNISVSITDKFMQAFKDNTSYELRTPSTGEPVGEIPARALWDAIVDMAWKTADPGVLFIDTINKMNVLKKSMIIETCNPCGEQPLPPYGCCNLSSINIHKFCKEGNFDSEKLYKTVYDVTRLMDNLIDIMEFPDERFKKQTLKYRPIGIGPMGLSDAMFELGLAYDTAAGKKFAGDVMRIMTTASIEASADLAKEKGTFSEYETVKDDLIEIFSILTDSNENVMKKVKKYGVRNCQNTTAAPTGTTALTADCSYGIEPCFGLVFTKTLSESGDKMLVVNPIFKKYCEKETWYTGDILEKIAANGGSLKGLHGIPKNIKDVFVVAHDIKFKDRIDVQAELQKYCSTAISSTLNLPKSTTRDEISELYRYAYQKGLKGVTIYRDGCKKDQPIEFSKDKTQVVSNFERPSKLNSTTYTIETGNGKLYITVSTHAGRPVEIFLSMGKSGQLFNVFAEALGRSISIALQHGVSVESIVKTLIGINSDRITWFRFEESDKKPAQILSIPDAIAQLLKRYYVGTGEEDTTIQSDEMCPKCGTYSVAMIEGCKSCMNCGHAACS